MAEGAIPTTKNDRVRVDENDPSADYLANKLISSDGSVDLSVSSCGCELDLSVNGGYSEKWIKTTVTYEDYNTASFNVDFTPTEFTDLPAGTTPLYYKIKHSESFTGGAVASADLRIKITGFTQTNVDILRAVGDEVGASGQLTLATTVMDNASPSDIVLRLECTGATCNNLTQGVCDVWIKVATLL